MKINQNNKLRLVLIGVNSLFYIAMSVYSPFLASYYTQQNVTPQQMGFLFAIGPVVTIIIQPKWAKISDYTEKRKSVLLLAVAGAGVSILFYYLAHGFLGFFLVTALFSCFSTALLPLSDAIVVPLSGKSHFNYAYIRMGGTIGYAITVYLAGFVIKTHPGILFLLGACMYFVMMLIVLQLPRDSGSVKKKTSGGKAVIEKKDRVSTTVTEKRTCKKIKPAVTKIFQSKEAYFVLGFAFIYQIGMSFASGFLGAYIIKLGYSQKVIGIANSISAFSEVPILIFIDRLVRKFGIMKMVAFSCLMTAVRIFCISSGVLPIIMLSQLLQSVTYMTTYFCCVTYISKNVLPGKQAQGQSILAKLQTGVAGIMGYLGGGYILDRIGYQRTYFLFSAVVFVAGMVNYLLYFLYQNRKLLVCRLHEKQ